MDDMNHLENDHVYVVFWCLMSLHAWHELRMAAHIRLQIIDAFGQQQHRQTGMASNSIQFRGTYFGFLGIYPIQLQLDPAAIRWKNARIATCCNLVKVSNTILLTTKVNWICVIMRVYARLPTGYGKPMQIWDIWGKKTM